ncbi:MAG: hypothetical protein FJ087_17070 [Deltaproteobacteria bacterium]|nr:hypothetical protein [Deltaproteobacteria bacterium]
MKMAEPERGTSASAEVGFVCVRAVAERMLMVHLALAADRETAARLEVRRTDSTARPRGAGAGR